MINPLPDRSYGQRPADIWANLKYKGERRMNVSEPGPGGWELDEYSDSYWKFVGYGDRASLVVRCRGESYHDMVLVVERRTTGQRRVIRARYEAVPNSIGIADPPMRQIGKNAWEGSVSWLIRVVADFMAIPA